MFNIMDPYFNFNITGSMTFEGIAFSGAEAAALYTSDHYPPVNRIPIKKCEVKPINDKTYLPLTTENTKSEGSVLEFNNIVEEQIPYVEDADPPPTNYDYNFWNVKDYDCKISSDMSFTYEQDSDSTCENDLNMGSTRSKSIEPLSFVHPSRSNRPSRPT